MVKVTPVWYSKPRLSIGSIVSFKSGIELVISLYTFLSDGLISTNQVKLEYPTEANEVFVKLPKKMVEHLNSEEYMMSDDELEGKTVRLVTAWNTKSNEVDEFLNTIVG